MKKEGRRDGVAIGVSQIIVSGAHITAIADTIGIGIFLEKLRLRGPELFKPAILAYYEAYDYGQKFAPENKKYALVTIIAGLLQSPSRKHNRRGNQYFLKFRALLEIIAEQGGLNREDSGLSREFCFAMLLPLVRLATVIGGRREPDGRQEKIYFNN